MNTEAIQSLLKNVKQGSLSIDEAVEQLRHFPFEDLGFAKIDHHRQIRCGFPEVIFCPGKTTEQIIDIFGKLAAKGNNVIASRAEPKVFEALSATGKFPKARYEKLARMIVLEQAIKKISNNYIAIVTAGTADMPVAEEYISKEEAQKHYKLERLPDDAGDSLRIIRIGDYDACPCIGSHVNSSKEIGGFRIVSSSFEDGVLRIRYRIAQPEK